MSNEKNAKPAVSERPKPPAGFVQVSADLPMYSAESCGNLPAHGKLFDHVNMPDAKGDDGQPKQWSALVLKALTPTIGMMQDGAIVEIKAGDKFMIGMGKALLDLGKLAENREYIFEVWLMPGTKKKIQGTAKTFVPWEININPKPEKRPTGAFSLRSYTSAPVAALPQHAPSANGAAPVSEENLGSSEIPF